MKKTIVVLSLICIILTGCTKVTKDVAINETKNTSTGNLIIEHPAEETFTEDELVTYIDSVNYQVEELTSKETLTEQDEKTLENTFITLTDFIFYGGVINGKTFEELTTETKQKIVSIYEKLDQKIESKIPGYKEKIKRTATNTYENVKDKVENLKETIKDKYIEDFGQDKYDQVEKAYQETKENWTENIDEAYQVIIDVSRDFYEENKNRAENWYKNYKESRN